MYVKNGRGFRPVYINLCLYDFKVKFYQTDEDIPLTCPPLQIAPGSSNGAIMVWHTLDLSATVDNLCEKRGQ